MMTTLKAVKVFDGDTKELMEYHFHSMCGKVSMVEGDDAQPCDERFVMRFHTGTYDRNGKMIFEGDTLRSKSCEVPFLVTSIVDFLMMCGEYKAKNGVDIFDSLEVI